MSPEYPEHLRYLDSHEYCGLEGSIATLGITAYAVEELGDIVFVELPAVGSRVTRGQTFGTVESVKAVEDLNSPVTGLVTERNQPVVDAPEVLAADPYGQGWLIRVQVEEYDPADTLSASEYRQRLEG